MRRSLGGWLAALLLLGAAGCGSGDQPTDAAPPSPPAIVVPTLAVSMRTPVPAVDELTVLVTAAGGIDSPGLDAVVSVLSTRPGLRVVVVAPATTSNTGSETGVVAAAFDGTTASGHPAQVVNAPVADAVAVAVDELRVDPDLVVVGADDGAAVGATASSSPSIGAARSAVRRGVPALAVTMGDEHGADLAATVLALGTVLDFELDHLLEQVSVTVLAVPSCAAGMVRGPISVEHSSAETAGPPDCTGPDAEHDTDVAAHAAGYTTVTRTR